MTDSTDAGRQQPDREDPLEATAIDLISQVVQEAFLELDPLELVRRRAPQLSADDQAVVAHLIDEAAVELEVDFSGHEHD